MIFLIFCHRVFEQGEGVPERLGFDDKCNANLVTAMIGIDIKTRSRSDQDGAIILLKLRQCPGYEIHGIRYG